MPSQLVPQLRHTTRTSEDGDAYYAADYGFDGYGRLQHVTGPGLPSAGSVHGAYYSFLSGSDLVSLTEFKNDNVVRAEAKRQYETTRDLLDYVENGWRNAQGTSYTVLSKYDYTNDNLGRRTGVVHSGSAFTTFTQTLSYNDRNELHSSSRSDVGTYNRAWDYDPIGNRTDMTEGSGSPVTTEYTSNELNQYAHADRGGTPKTGQGFRFDEDGNLSEAFVAGDMNCDGAVDNFDTDAFTLAVTAGPPNYTAYYAQYPSCNALNCHGAPQNQPGVGASNPASVDACIPHLVVSEQAATVSLLASSLSFGLVRVACSASPALCCSR